MDFTSKTKTVVLIGLFNVFSFSQDNYSLNIISGSYRPRDFPAPHMFFQYPSLGGEQPGISLQHSISRTLSGNTGIPLNSILLGLKIQNILGLNAMGVFTGIGWSSLGASLDESESGQYGPSPYSEQAFTVPIGIKLYLENTYVNGLSFAIAPTLIKYNLFNIEEIKSKGLTISAHVNLMESIPWAKIISGVNLIHAVSPELELSEGEGVYKLRKKVEISNFWESPTGLINVFHTLPFWNNHGTAGMLDFEDPGSAVFGVGIRPIDFLEFRLKHIWNRANYLGLTGIVPLSNFWLLTDLRVDLDLSHDKFSSNNRNRGLFASLQFFFGVNPWK